MSKTTLFLVLTLTLFTGRAHANLHRHHSKVKKVRAQAEVWCGASSDSEYSRFPYKAAIQSINPKRGSKAEVVTVFEKNKIVYRDYVHREYSSTGLVFRDRDDAFALKFTPNADKDAVTHFRAVIHDRDGVKMIANGEFPCHQS